MNRNVRIVRHFLFPAGILAAHLIASRILGLYQTFPNLDVPFHIAGGISISYTAAGLLGFMRTRKWISPIDRALFGLILVTTTAAAAMLWEFMEFAADLAFGTNIQISLANTMHDQFLGVLGGAAMALRMIRSAPD